MAVNEELGSRNSQVISLVNLGTVEYLASRLEHAREHLDRAVELSRAIGNFSGSYDAQRWLALVHLTAGHHARAAELATSAIELAARGGTGGRRPTRTPLWRPSSWRAATPSGPSAPAGKRCG
jgi:hypothetical protein